MKTVRVPIAIFMPNHRNSMKTVRVPLAISTPIQWNSMKTIRVSLAISPRINVNQSKPQGYPWDILYGVLAFQVTAVGRVSARVLRSYGLIGDRI